MRVVLDTNVVVSAFLSPNGVPAKLFDLWRLQAFEVVVSEVILTEYSRALLYDHVAARHRLSGEELAEVVDGFRQSGILVAPRDTLNVIDEDPADNRVLECAVAGGAEFIVSGDRRHLLRLQDFQGIQILSPAAFLSVVQD